MSDPHAFTIDSAAPDPALVGLPRRIGPYTVLARIGAGGMGQVLLGESRKPERRVAIKLLLSSAVDNDAIARFEREMQALARLDHPGIARLHESGFERLEGGLQPWYAMELVDGVPLDEYVRTRKSAVREVLKLVALVADALHHAHQKGVVHRDIKPSNVLVSADGLCKLVDFGIARIEGADGVRQTQAGQLLGTLAYMSPEQLHAAGDIDVRSDVYSLGVVLYELLTGELPVKVTTTHLLAAVKELSEGRRVPIEQRDPRFEGDIAKLVEVATHPDIARRYGSAASFKVDIDNFLAHRPLHARPPGALDVLRKFVMRNPLLMAAAAVVVLALGGALWWSIRAAAHEQQARDVAERRLDQVMSMVRNIAFQQADLLTHLPQGREVQVQTLNAALTELNALQREMPEHRELMLSRASLNARIAQASFSLGGVHLNDPSAALVHADAALALYDSLGAPTDEASDFVGYARMLLTRAEVARAQQRDADANADLARSVALIERGSQLHPQDSGIWNQYALCARALGALLANSPQPSAAFKWFEKAEFALGQELKLPQSESHRARSLLNLAATIGARALAHQSQLEFSKTVELLERELPLVAQALALEPNNLNIAAEAISARNNWIIAALELDDVALLRAKGVAMAAYVESESARLREQNAGNSTTALSYVRVRTPAGQMWLEIGERERARAALEIAESGLRTILAEAEDPALRLRLARTLWLQARLDPARAEDRLTEAEHALRASGLIDRSALLLKARILIAQLGVAPNVERSARIQSATSALQTAREFGPPSAAQLATEAALKLRTTPGAYR
jgi:tetratricopeptide (TPR) repeat protein